MRNKHQFMQARFLAVFITCILLLPFNDSEARPRRSKSCVRKVLLPGQSKPVKCKKARRIKSDYFF
ncbi:MAG: hypothetical protein U0U67_14785 [Chitinophagales bacterium]